jgi:hypothetical protein
MVATMVIFKHWVWLWDRSRSAVSPGVSGAPLEVILLLAMSVFVAALTAWIVQAVMGLRSTDTGPAHALAFVRNVVPLVLLALLVAAFRPVSLAQNLYATSDALERDAYRLIPLGLCEAAARLDPTTPKYLAHAAELNEALGMKDAALAKRDIIEYRAEQYSQIIEKKQRAHHMALASLFVALPTLDDTPMSTPTFDRIKAMIAEDAD